MAKTVGKEPWLAVNLSMILSGLGHLYAGQPLRGWVLILNQLILPLLGVLLLLAPSGNAWAGLGLGCFLLSFALNIGGLFDAYRAVKAQNDPAFEAARSSEKDPWRAVFFSRLFLGLGHLYLGKIAIGLFLLLWGVMSFFYPLLGVLGFLATPFVLYGVYKDAPVRRETSNKLIVIIAILSGIISPLVALLFAFTLRTWIAEARYIPSGAMEPTLMVDDRMIIDKVSYRFNDPQRGDIVVFKPTTRLQQIGFKEALIKRIVGLPGDRVAIVNQRLQVNGQPLAEPYLPEGTITVPEVCNDSQAYLMQPQTIPANNYLVLGDNRSNSFDGRCWGLMTREDIIGKAARRFWPPERWGAINPQP
jgi:signal peptidase I